LIEDDDLDRLFGDIRIDENINVEILDDSRIYFTLATSSKFHSQFKDI